MTRNELINDVVRVYFEGGNWQARLKELAREVKKSENIFDRADHMCDSASEGQKGT